MGLALGLRLALWLSQVQDSSLDWHYDWNVTEVKTKIGTGPRPGFGVKNGTRDRLFQFNPVGLKMGPGTTGTGIDSKTVIEAACGLELWTEVGQTVEEMVLNVPLSARYGIL